MTFSISEGERELAKVSRNRYLGKQTGGKVLVTPAALWDTLPIVFESIKLAPRLELSPPTGATALEVQQVNHHSRKNVRQKSGCNVPEEVLHEGYPPFRRSVPRRDTYPNSRTRANVSLE